MHRCSIIKAYLLPCTLKYYKITKCYKDDTYTNDKIYSVINHFINVVSVANMDLILDKQKERKNVRDTLLSIGVKYRLRNVIRVFNVDSGTKPCFVYKLIITFSNYFLI